MVELSLPGGPWSKIVNAQWQAFPVSLYESPSKEVLMCLFEKEDDKTTGLISVVNKIYRVIGDSSKLETSEKRHDLTIFTKVSRQGTHKFLFLYSEPRYCSFTQVEIRKTIDAQLLELNTIAESVKELEAEYGFKLVNFKEENEENVQLLLSDPLLLFALFNPLAVKSQTGNLAVPIGKSSDGEIFSVKLEDLTACTVIGATKQERLCVIQVIAENALQNNIPVIVFDGVNFFDGLARPNSNLSEVSKFKDFGLLATPAGYPYKKFKLGRDVFIDLLKAEPKELPEVFAFNDLDFTSFVVKTIEDKKLSISTLLDLTRELENTSNSAATQYIKLKAIRVIKTLQKTYGGLFSKTTPFEIALPWKDGIGKALHLDVSKQEEQIVKLFVKTIIELVPRPPASNLSVLFAFELENAADFAVQINEKFTRKAAFAVHSQNEVQLKQVKNVTLVIKIAGNAFISTISTPEKRIEIRPTYSQKGQLSENFTAMPIPTPNTQPKAKITK